MMRQKRCRALFLAPYFIASLFAFTLNAQEPAAEADNTLAPIIENLDSEDLKEKQQARDDLRQKVFDAGSPEADPVAAQEMEAALLPMTTADNPQAVRVWVIRQLVFIGGEPTVQAMAHLLADPEPRIRNEAREILAAIDLPTATAALVAALKNAQTLEDALGALAGLAYKGPQAQPAIGQISPLLASDEPRLAREAVLTLGKIGGEEAQAALLNAYAQAPDLLKPEIEKNLILTGMTDDAAAHLAEAGANPGIRAGAFHVLAKQNPAQAQQLLEKALAKPELEVRPALVRVALTADAPQLVQALLENLSSLPATEQVVALGVIADKKLAVFEPTVRALAQEAEDQTLQGAALQTLAQIATSQSYPFLKDLLAKGQHKEHVGEAIARIDDPAIDEQLLQEAATGEPAARVAAIELLGMRNPNGAVDLLNSVLDPRTPPEVLQAAMDVLQKIGDLDTARGLLQLVLASEDTDTRRKAQLALKRLADNLEIHETLWTDVFEPAIAEAESDQSRESIVLILDAVKDKRVLAFLQELALGDHAVLRPAALQTLRRWHHVEMGDAWLAIAASPQADEQEKKLAWSTIERAIKSNDISGRMDDKIELAVTAFQAAPDAAQRKKILDIYSEVKNRRERRQLKEKFQPLTEDPELGSEVQEFLDALET